jgi:hypothetical protein
MGVRLVQVILDNPDRTGATTEFCRTWQGRYGLSNEMAIDPTRAVRRFAGGTLPGVVIFDARGTIRFIGHGTPLNTISAQVYRVLEGGT